MSAQRDRFARLTALFVLPLIVASSALAQSSRSPAPAASASSAQTAPASAGAGQAGPGAASPGQTASGQSAGVQTAATAPASPPRSHRSHAHRRTAEQAVLHDVQVRATEQPRAPEFVNSTLHYPFEAGKIYTIHTAPDFLTAIALRPGEKLVSKAAGDTVRWIVGETAQGTGAQPQIIILIKPLEPGLHTNLILTTDQRMYQLELISNASGDYSTMVDWSYPAEDLRDLQVQRAALTVAALAAKSAALTASPFITPPTGAQPGAAPAAGTAGLVAGGRGGAALEPVGAPLAATQLHFTYKVEAQRHAPRWTPEHVFDDGQKTYIKFPAAIATMEIPPLFLLGPKGQMELVNYRLVDGYYVVDRLFDRAELRLGVNDQNAVQIAYTGGAR
jgi:type IV secretion system protein VirB9